MYIYLYNSIQRREFKKIGTGCARASPMPLQQLASRGRAPSPSHLPTKPRVVHRWNDLRNKGRKEHS